MKRKIKEEKQLRGELNDENMTFFTKQNIWRNMEMEAKNKKQKLKSQTSISKDYNSGFQIILENENADKIDAKIEFDKKYSLWRIKVKLK